MERTDPISWDLQIQTLVGVDLADARRPYACVDLGGKVMLFFVVFYLLFDLCMTL